MRTAGSTLRGTEINCLNTNLSINYGSALSSCISNSYRQVHFYFTMDLNNFLHIFFLNIFFVLVFGPSHL